METPAQESESRHAKLNLWDTTSLIVGIIIGVGIFFLPARVFAGVNGPWQAIGLWVLGGVFSFIGALCFAELASTYPRSGGEYVYLTRAYGSGIGFLFAWTQIIVIRPAGTTGVIAYAFGNFTCYFLGIQQYVALISCIFALAIILLFTVVNILGVLLGKVTQNALTALKVLGVVGLLGAGFLFGHGWGEADNGAYFHGKVTQAHKKLLIVERREGTSVAYLVTPKTNLVINGEKKEFKGDLDEFAKELVGREARMKVDEVALELVTIKSFSMPLWAMIALGLIPVLWTYNGWHEGAYVVAEVREKTRTIPLALMLGTGAVVLIYVAVNLACLSALGFEKAGESQAISADVLRVALGDNGARAMALLVMLSCLGAVNGTIFTSSRIFAAMGEDHALFSWLGEWNRKLGTPVIALLMQGILSMGMVVFVNVAFPGNDPFDALLYCTSAAFWVFFLLTGLSLFVFRFKEPNLLRPFRVPLYPVVPILFCLGCGWMAYSSVTFVPVHSLVGLGLLLAGVPFYIWSSYVMKRDELPRPPETGIQSDQTGFKSM